MDGGITIKSTLLLAGIALSVAVLSAPMINTAVEVYAENRALGIDRVITSSIDKGNRVTIRRSVLSDQEERICSDPKKTDC